MKCTVLSFCGRRGVKLELYLKAALVFLLNAVGVVAIGTESGPNDWNRFRGPNGTGVVVGEVSPPVTWSPTENLAWMVDLPGPGSSSPIVVGDLVFVTCWTGSNEEGGAELENPLRRHLICLNRLTGEVRWDRSVLAVLPEDRFEGMFAEHGYASHTPTSDGERVFAFFGKSGVYAFDLEGNQLWHQMVGEGLDSRSWGSSSSPILFEDLVIVTAAAESQTIFAFDKASGELVWKQSADSLESTWGTPVLVDTTNGGKELVIGVPNEIWSFDPRTGEFLWFCGGLETDSYCSSVIAEQGIVYGIEGRGGGSIAVRSGGKDDVSQSHLVWSGKDRNQIGTPILVDDRIYFISGRIANCLDAATGKSIYQSRLSTRLVGAENTEASAISSQASGANRGSAGASRMGARDYSSPILAGGLIYFTGRDGLTFVIRPGDKLEQVAVNHLSVDEDEEFSGTPAVAGDILYVRSSKRLYALRRNSEP